METLAELISKGREMLAQETAREEEARQEQLRQAEEEKQLAMELFRGHLPEALREYVIAAEKIHNEPHFWMYLSIPELAPIRVQCKQQGHSVGAEDWEMTDCVPKETRPIFMGPYRVDRFEPCEDEGEWVPMPRQVYAYDDIYHALAQAAELGNNYSACMDECMRRDAEPKVVVGECRATVEEQFIRLLRQVVHSGDDE